MSSKFQSRHQISVIDLEFLPARQMFLLSPNKKSAQKWEKQVVSGISGLTKISSLNPYNISPVFNENHEDKDAKKMT